MDGLKLSKWKENFEAGITNLHIEFDAFLLPKKLQEFYSLPANEENQNLVVEILNHHEFPKEIEDRITEIYESSKPVDSM